MDGNDVQPVPYPSFCNPLHQRVSQAVAGFRHELGVEGAFGLLVASADVAVGVGAFAGEVFG